MSNAIEASRVESNAENGFLLCCSNEDFESIRFKRDCTNQNPKKVIEHENEIVLNYNSKIQKTIISWQKILNPKSCQCKAKMQKINISITEQLSLQAQPGESEELAQLGVSVYVCARSEADLKQRLQEWNDAGLTISGCVCDVSSYPSCEQLMTQVSEHFQGKLHILVLNAARAGVRGPILEVPVEDMASTLRSTAIFPFYAMYHCTKGALNQLTKNLALAEWAKDGIHVNTVAPGFTQTDMASSLGDEMLGAVKMRTPMRRLGEVHEIAAAVAFLCLPCSSFTTGTIFTIDGGMSCHNSIAACANIDEKS
ncbi:hypothetical protein GOP47_0020991 [Adiantum capillus-veneris]|uniref:Uncharacterized protein n=1 Tax=Adiantum capillus-veneris TaxID=13818 RepID=A0A9D4UC28_ADICA|nr:hypothetical protein GOP47_0020991 [Adiantum capillus-veneris]